MLNTSVFISIACNITWLSHDFIVVCSCWTHFPFFFLVFENVFFIVGVAGGGGFLLVVIFFMLLGICELSHPFSTFSHPLIHQHVPLAYTVCIDMPTTCVHSNSYVYLFACLFVCLFVCPGCCCCCAPPDKRGSFRPDYELIRLREEYAKSRQHAFNPNYMWWVESWVESCSYIIDTLWLNCV